MDLGVGWFFAIPLALIATIVIFVVIAVIIGSIAIMAGHEAWGSSLVSRALSILGL